MINGQSDILCSKPSFSLCSALTFASMEGKVLVKNPHGSSKVWKHFGFYKAGNTILKDFAVCFVCKQQCKYSGGTTNLNQHLEKHHRELCQASTSTSGSKSIQSQITSMMKQPVIKFTAAAQSLCSESVAEFICGDLVPLSTVESKNFKGMVNILSGGRYDCPSRKYFTENLLPKMMKDCSESMKKEVQNINGIGLTTDSWTSGASENYITYTAHYITDEWEMKSRVLSTHCSQERHTAENLAADMKKTEQNWGLNKLIFDPVYIHDNASNVTKAPQIMDKPRLGIGCLAHTINLAANSATSIQQVSELLNKARKIGSAIKRSTLASIIFKKNQDLLLPSKQHKLKLDCPTRWNSSYEMLERFNEQLQVRMLNYYKNN